jgi:hypothetical protein
LCAQVKLQAGHNRAQQQRQLAGLPVRAR